MSETRRCIGYGEFDGKCENEAGTPWALSAGPTSTTDGGTSDDGGEHPFDAPRPLPISYI